MRVRHTVIFTFYESTIQDEIQEVIKRLGKMGEYLTKELGVTNWKVAKHIPESFKDGRAHLLQDGIFPDIDALSAHANSDAHKAVIQITPTVCDWMTIDTEVTD